MGELEDKSARDLLHELATTVAVQGNAIGKMEILMAQNTEALGKLAVLEEHRLNFKVVERDIYTKVNKNIQDMAVVQSKMDRFIWLERVVYGSLITSLIGAVTLLIAHQ